MITRLRFFLLALLLPIAALAAGPAFAQAESDLKPDPAVHYGSLPNGLRYVVRANREPRGRASLRLLVEAGSLNESADQRGLAHFLEHMAFNGSTHYAANTLVEYFQRMGMSFGGDTNASTSFDRTLYLLELSDTKPATLAEGLRVFSDYAGGLLIQPAQIEKERPIILSEKRARDSVGSRTFEAEISFLLKGTRFPERVPIGQAEIIEKSQRDRFADFYDTWYRPELMTVVAVGDFDVAAMEKLIVAGFSGVAARKPAPPPVDLGKIPTAPGKFYLYHYESEAPATSVEIGSYSPYTREPDTAVLRLKYFPRDLAVAMVDRRLAILAKEEGSPFSSGRITVQEEYNFFREASISLTCKADQWVDALGVADRELRRALQYGFQPAELREQTESMLNALRESSKSASTRRSPEIAEDIAQSVLDKSVYTSPDQDLGLYGPALQKVTVDDCVAALRNAFSPQRRNISVTGNAKLPKDSDAAIAAAFDRAEALPVDAPKSSSDSAWGYSQFGVAGSVAKRQHVNDLDITQVQFANGVRLNLKKTDFQANQVQVSIRVGTGQLTEPHNEPGLGNFASGTFTAGGLGKHSADDLRRILAGKTVNAHFSVAGDALIFSGATNQENLPLELQLLSAFITDPGYRPEAARQVKKSLDQLYLSLEHTTRGPLTLEVQRLLANGDPRFGLPPQSEMNRRSLAEEKTWLSPQLGKGPIEVAIVGDIDVEAAIKDVGATLGALPPREAKPALDDLRKVSFPSLPIAKQYHIQTEIPKGLLAFYWPTTDDRDVRLTRRLTLLAETLTERLRVQIREKLGGAYSPGAGLSASDVYPGYGFLIVNVTLDPERAKEIEKAVETIATDMATQGISEDELSRAKLPAMTEIRETARTNGYWIGSVLARAQERPEMLDWARTRTTDFESITRDDVNALAKKYLSPGRDFRFVILPEKSTAPSGAAPITDQPAPGAPAGPASPAGPGGSPGSGS